MQAVGFYLNILEPLVLSLMICAIRALVVISFIPVFSSRVSAKMVRNVAVFSIVCIPAYYMSKGLGATSLTVGEFLYCFLKECFLGLLLGITLGIPFIVFEGVGEWIDNIRGATSARQNNPFSSEEDFTTGFLFSLLGGVFLIETGYFNLLIRLLIESYQQFPPLSLNALQFEAVFSHFIKILAEMLSVTILLSLPIIVAVLVTDFVFALISVYAPSLQVYFLVGGAKGVFALFVMLLYTDRFCEFIRQQVLSQGDYVERLFNLMAGR